MTEQLEGEQGRRRELERAQEAWGIERDELKGKQSTAREIDEG